MNETDFMTLKEEYILDAMVELGSSIHYKNRQIEELLAQTDDLTQRLSATMCQLEEARKLLARYEGGGE